MEGKDNFNEMGSTTGDVRSHNEGESNNGESNDSRTTTATTTFSADTDFMDTNGKDGESSLQQRRTNRFVSRHRKALDHMAQDSTQSLRHDVPAPLKNTDDDRSSRTSAVGGQLTGKFRASCRSAVADMDSWDSWLELLLPMTRWIKGYNWKKTFVQDLIAGCTVGVMIVPQSMSYAKLAGLPVEYGLYSALVPVFAYAFFGSSRQLAVGPVALISLLLSTGVTHILNNEGYDRSDETYRERYNQLAVQMSFLVGVTNICMGVFRLGFITVFLSHAVISGFTSKLHFT